MRIDVLTIFPEAFPGPLAVGVVGRALAAGQVSVSAHDLRDFTEDRQRQVDDTPFGGGPGMVLKPEPIIRAVRRFREERPSIRTILLSPQGRLFTQEVARELALHQDILLVCGRYQGVDERARQEIGEELSVGDFILSGGEIGAMAVIEAVARLVPGTVGSPESLVDETFSSEGFEPPLYTRPAEFDGREVPAVLRGGDHAAIQRWHREQRDTSTRRQPANLVRSGSVTGGQQ